MSAKFHSAILIISIFSIVAAKKSGSDDNNILFEKLEYRVLDHEFVTYCELAFRPVAHNVYMFNYTFVLSRPMKTGWVHFVLYHKYNTYTKFLIDLWEDYCAFWDGANGHPLSILLKENVLRLGVKYNFPWHCPLSGTLNMRHDGLNASHIILPLLPAGRYRLDATLSGAKDSLLYVEQRYYFKVSDLRVWY